jgi:hypothetical protein
MSISNLMCRAFTPSAVAGVANLTTSIQVTVSAAS